MKKSEMVKILKFLNNYYQNKFKFPKESDMDTKQIIETWYIFLGEYDYEVVSASLKKLVVNQAKWPPTPGEVIQEIDQNLNENNSNRVSGPEAWNMLLKAIRKHSWFYNPSKVREELPESVVKAAEVTGFGLVANSSEGDSFVMNRFIKTYEQIRQHENEREMLPGGIRKNIEKIERTGVKQLVGEKRDKNG